MCLPPFASLSLVTHSEFAAANEDDTVSKCNECVFGKTPVSQSVSQTVCRLGCILERHVYAFH